MERSSHLPPFDRISTILAVILSSFALGQFINISPQIIPIQIAGVYFPIIIQFNTIISLAVAGMTAAGADWLIRRHPKSSERNQWPHLILPGLSAFIISLPLSSLPVGLNWWFGFIIGGSFLAIVLIAEYISLDPEDVRQQVAGVVLTALAYTLFLILIISINSVNMRLFIKLPLLLFGAFFVSLRVNHVNNGEWKVTESLATAIIVTQLGSVLHYLPVAPINSGLFLFGPIYAIDTLIANIAKDEPITRAVIGPAILLAAIWLIALIWR